MQKNNNVLKFFIWFCRFNFGSFEVEEFKKFLRMGLILAFIVGIYWTLKALRDSLFIQFVDKMHIPYAKTLSVLALLPIVIFYTKLLERTSREKMFIILSFFYGISILLFGVLIIFIQFLANYTFIVKFIGYVWYVFVESFGSLFLALFWAFLVDTTKPSSAKKGFGLVCIVGQMGGIVCPYSIGGLSHHFNLTNDGLSIIILGILAILIAPIFIYFLKCTSKNCLVSFHGKNELELIKRQEHDFLEGLKLLLSHKYLIGIFVVIFAYDVIVSIFDFNFQISASTQYTGVALSHYLSVYSSSVNIFTVFLLFFGINNITRFLGLRTALIIAPVILGFALLGFLYSDSLSFLFYLMIVAKSIHLALNQPCLKQLYAPTTKDVRFKAQAWIEIFGNRIAQQSGSFFNMLLDVLGKKYYLIFSGIFGFPLIVLWMIIILYLVKHFNVAIKQKKVIC